MFTGVNPGKHGIVDFVLREAGKFVPCLSRYRMSKTIWRIVSDSGRKCIIINDPVTFPPEKVNGIMTCGLMTPPRSSNWIYPIELRHEINTLARGYECDIPPDFSVMLSKNRKAAIDLLDELFSKLFRVSKYVSSSFDWDLLAVFLTTTDRVQHFWWDDTDEISRHYEKIDVMVGEFIERADAMAADLIVVSDHGFGPCKHFFSINEWLEGCGLAAYTQSLISMVLSELDLTKVGVRRVWGDWPRAFTMLPSFIQDIVRKHVPESEANRRELDIKRSAAYAKTSCGVFLRDPSLQTEELLARRLRGLKDNVTGTPIFTQVMTREDALQGPYSYRAPNLLLQPSLGYDVLVGKSELEAKRVGTHRPEGIFIRYSSESAASSHMPDSASIRPWDVAASVLHILDIPIPDYFDGRPKIASG